MLLLSRKQWLTMEALAVMARDARGTPMSGKDLAEQLGLPQRYLEQVMQQLVRQGLLRGIRGPGGGYVLARERRRITLADIAECLAKHDDTRQPLASEHMLEPVLGHINSHLHSYLSSITLEALCQTDKPLSDMSLNQDFTI